MRPIEDIIKDLAKRDDAHLQRMVRNDSGAYSQRIVDAAQLVLDRRHPYGPTSVTFIAPPKAGE